jgi:putative ABC transport system permease protein
MTGLGKDVRYAVRLLARHPGFAIAAVLTIALGIGANAAIFSVVQAVLLRPLPYADADRLVTVWAELRNRDVLYFPHSPPDVQDMREQVSAFERVEGVFTFAQSLRVGDAQPEQVPVAAVTPGLLSMLGVMPEVGRLLTEEDAAVIAPPAQGQPAPPPAPNNVLLSYGAWQRRFGGASDIEGRSIQVGGNPATVVGVLPPDTRVHLPVEAGVVAEPEVWVAPRIDYVNAPRGNVSLRVIAKLAPGAALESARTQVEQLAARSSELYPRYATSGYALRVVPLHRDLTAQVRPIVLALLGAVGFVLLIACANVANLLLVRSTARRAEISVRYALGGSRGRLVRQLFIESAILALAGAVAGIGLAFAGVELLLALQPRGLPRIDTVRIDGTVLGYAAGATILAALLFGLFPALHSARVDLAGSLRERMRIGGVPSVVRNGVVILEVALCVVLLAGAGLMARSFNTLRNVDPGYDARNVLTFEVQLSGPRFADAAARSQFWTMVQQRIAALPGVQNASAGFPVPLDGTTFNGPFGPEDAINDPERFNQAMVRVVLPEYFESLRTPVHEGRTFTAADQSDSTAYVVVDEVLARTTWPGESAVGKRIWLRFFTIDYIPAEVIGVVRHQRSQTLAAEGPPLLYYSDRFVGGFNRLNFAVRTAGDPLALVAPIRALLVELDPALPMSTIRPLQAYVDDAMASTRFALVLIAIFGAAALTLAAIGLYGVLAYVVGQRTSEIGVRMAFGASAASIGRMVLRQGMSLALAGLGVGMVAAFALTRVLRSMLVGVEPADPLTFMLVAIVFLGVATLATWLPARRATRVEPVTALRADG